MARSNETSAAPVSRQRGRRQSLGERRRLHLRLPSAWRGSGPAAGHRRSARQRRRRGVRSCAGTVLVWRSRSAGWPPGRARPPSSSSSAPMAMASISANDLGKGELARNGVVALGLPVQCRARRPMHAGRAPKAAISGASSLMPAEMLSIGRAARLREAERGGLLVGEEDGDPATPRAPRPSVIGREIDRDALGSPADFGRHGPRLRAGRGRRSAAATPGCASREIAPRVRPMMHRSRR